MRKETDGQRIGSKAAPKDKNNATLDRKKILIVKTESKPLQRIQT